MKKWMLFLVVATFMVSANAFANLPVAEEDKGMIINVDQVADKQFVLHLANLEKQVTLIQIEDLKGRVYFNERVRNHNGYARKINLKKIPEGRYILSIKQDQKNFAQVMVVQDNKVVFSKMKERS